METPNILKGHLYPSSRVSRCDRFHACQVTKKCQNFDRHCHDCILCESRVTHMEDKVRGMLAEGEYMPDLQDSMNILEMAMHVPLAHPDAKQTKFDTSDRAQKVGFNAEKAKRFLGNPEITMEQKVMETLMVPENRKYLGRNE